MNESKENQDINQLKPNKYLIGPGMGLIIMGISYILWWIGPWAWESFFQDQRWAHNWAYAIILLTVGLAWYHKSAVSRTIILIQAFMLPVVASGSFNSLLMTLVTMMIAYIWAIVVILEKRRGKLLFQEKMQKRTWLWINMHVMVVAWLLIAHMALMFLIVRAPLEQQLLGFGTHAGFLANLPPENLEFATWAFDIALIVWALIVLWEQFQMGYNTQNKPWPKYSFYMGIICMVSSLLALLIQELTIGF